MRHRPDEHLDDLPRSVLDNLLEGCQVIGPDYRYLYVNDAVLRHGKSTRDDLLGQSMMDAYPGIERTEMFGFLRECMEQRKPREMENEFTFPDGSAGWFELRFEPVPEGVAILSVDITERKRAESSLRRAMRAQRTLSRCNQTLVRATTEESFVRDVCALIVGEGEYPMAVISVARSGDDPAAVEVSCRGKQHELLGFDEGRAVLRRAAESDGPHVITLNGAGDDGWTHALKRYEIDACLALPVATAGRRMGTLVIFSADQRAFDSDERELLDEVALDLGHGVHTLRERRSHESAVRKLSEAQARTRAVYDHLPDATFVFQRAGSDFQMVDFNEVAAVNTSGRASALVGRAVKAFEEAVPNIRTDLTRSFNEHTVIRRELECQLPGASEVKEVALTYGFIPPDMVLLHVQDVTAQRQTERQLLAAQRLEAVGRLAGGVAHDFNNMLSVILMFASFSIEQLDESDPVRDELEQIREAAERAADLTRQLLAFSRKQVLQPKVTNLNEVIGGIEEMMRRLLEADIDIEVHLDPELGNVIADPGQTEQIVMNLAVNSRDAMPQGGKLTIETANVDLDEQYAANHAGVSSGRHVQLTVTDTGAGMDAETRDRIFDPFFTTKGEGKGTGLGLATVYGIVKQSGGHVWVYSEPGRGTSFKIYFPRVDAPAVSGKDDEVPVVATGDETLLLVEDEPGVRQAAARVLRASGYTVLTAGGSDEAIRVAREHPSPIDLLLTDIVMPGMNGKELADQLTARSPDLKVLFTSGYTGNAIVHHGVLDPGIRFIGKPFSVQELTEAVRRVLDDT